ncbi:MAG: hypothetical protein M3032_11940 [Verrucomicrobiota bacterium]|nr:hypothetical protein [Verrucomicrobiota bacterium]
MKDARSSSARRAHIDARTPPPRPVIGLEAEFTLFINDVPRKPENVFGTPRDLVRERMIPRTGRSYQLPAGGAIYFDTGVIEVATPIIELGPGCCYRATRLLWEQIRYLRRELDAWAKRNHCAARLQGFSAHYNFSFPAARKSRLRNASKLAHLLTHILPAPVALLATNRQSTAVGVRPRGSRLEITTDFTPDAALMLATCGFVAGAVEGVLHWEHYALDQIERHGIPQPTPLRLRKHSSRRGWRVLASSLQHNPFTCDPNQPIWKLRDGRHASLREIAAETMRPFRSEIRRLSDAPTVEHIEAVFAGDARSLLDFPDRPSAYDDVGHGVDWNRRRMRHWSRSQYEEVIHRVIAGTPIRIEGKRYKVERMQGWYEIVFREAKTGARRVFNLDELVRLTRKEKRARSSR